ncbi:integral membrane protein [Fusarium circinatum]|uniref:Integral membrane protein n=1 Tax=Fusarium circinatum TaxID=48490 RepID=A0A8H5WKS5_FUSCI|nr:integral membrane protein [Fusarium circinatum]
MIEEPTPWTPKVTVSEGVTIDDLTITFRRTIRVPDNKNTSGLPPDKGAFPLFKIQDYARKLPLSMAQKGGMFIPMYQREALWIDFESTKTYAIRIHVGNVNIVSGEPKVPTLATELRRRQLLKKEKSIQDYIVVPDQKWIDGVATAPGQVRQLVAMPMATGTSIEVQMNGEESTAGIQFDITRLDPLLSGPKDNINVMVKDLNGKISNYFLSRFSRVETLKIFVKAKAGVDVASQILVSSSQRLQNKLRLCDYNLKNGALLHLIVRLRGGSSMIEEPEMNIAAGGLIRQNIVEQPKGEYKKTSQVTINGQILNSASFQRVTGQEPPKSPISAATYAKAGYPFFSLDEEPTTISGNFSDLQSMAQLKGRPERNVGGIPILDVETKEILRAWVCKACKAKNTAVMRLCKLCKMRRPPLKERNKIGILNPEGSKTPFRLSWEIAEELEKKLTLF